MLFHLTFLLTVVLLIPSTICRHIDLDVVKASNRRHEDQVDESSISKRSVHSSRLRIHEKPPKTLHVQEGDTNFLECQAGGTPPPAVHWLKDGKVVSQNPLLEEKDHYMYSAHGMDISLIVSRLYLDCLSVEDEGEYTCVAENPFQRTSASTNVIVSSSDEETLCSEKIQGQVPRIFSWTKTLIANQGQNVTLNCRVDGYPRPTVRWLGVQKEELANRDIDKYEILPNGDLVIKSLRWSDMGNYECIAENIHGETTTEVFVYPAAVET